MPDTKISALVAVTAAATANEFAVNEAGTSKKVTVQQILDLLFTKIAGASGASGPAITLQKLTANSVDVTTTALSAAVMTTTGLGVGLWLVRYYLLYQAAATTTGIGFGVNHTGTATLLAAKWHHTTTGGAAATGVGDRVATVIAGQLEEGKTGVTMDAVIGSASAGVDTINVSILAELIALIDVTVSGSLELKIATEIAGSAVRIAAGSALVLTKIG